MKKTINKWDVISPTQQKVGKIFKIIAATIFLVLWTPAFIYAISHIPQVIVQVINFYTK